jgi:cytochrome b
LVLVQATLGLFANDEFEFRGPLADSISGKSSDLFTRVHVFLFDAILVCVWLHVCAITYYALVKRDNLVGPMWHGAKTADRLPSGLQLKFVSGARAAILLLAIAAVVVALILNLRRMLE